MIDTPRPFPAAPIPISRYHIRKALLLLGGMLAYSFGYALLFPMLGRAASAAALFFILLATGLYGFWGGVVGGALAAVLNLLLGQWLAPVEWRGLLLGSGGMGFALSLTLGAAVGGLYRMRGAVKNGEAARLQLAEILAATPDMVATAGRDGRLLYLNASGRRMLGIEPGDDLSAYRIGDHQHPETREKILAALSIAGRDGMWAGESLLVNHSGCQIPVSQVILAHRGSDGRLAYYSTVARDLRERERVETAEREARVLAEALFDTTAALNSTLDFDEVIDRILENVGRVLPHDAANLALIEGTLARVVRAHWPDGAAGSEREPALLQVAETPTLNRMMETGRPLVIPDPQASPLWTDLPGTRWIHSYIGAPVRVKGETIGFVNLNSTRPGFYGEAHLARLQAFADQAATALENARLLAETRRQADGLAALYAQAGDLAAQQDLPALLAALVTRAAALLAAPGGEIYLWDPARQELVLEVSQGLPGAGVRSLRLGEGINGRAAAERRPVAVEDYRAWDGRLSLPELQSVTGVLAVPMLFGGELFGTLLVYETGRPRAFNDAEARLLTLFAGNAASAVHNARLFAETRRRLAELEAVNRMSAALRAANTVDEMLPALLDETLTVLDTGAGAVWMFDADGSGLLLGAARGWCAEKPVRPDTTPVGEDLSGCLAGQQGGQNCRDADSRAGNFRGENCSCVLPPGWIPDGWNAACRPICSSQAALGLLFIAFQEPRRISPVEDGVFTTLAEIAGNALQRAGMHAHTESSLRRLSALHMIDLSINASLDLNVVGVILLDQVIAGTDAAARVLLLDPLSQSLQTLAASGFRSPAFSKARLRLSECPASRALLEGQTVQLPLGGPQPETGGWWFAGAGGPDPFAGLQEEGFTTCYGFPLAAKGQAKGVLEVFARSPLNADRGWLDFMETIAGQAAMAVENLGLFADLQRSNVDLTLAYDATIEGWSRALDLRDQETEGHTQRVTELTLRLAQALGMNEAQLVQVRRGALLHDIGKMGIPDRILLKPGPLSAEEWEVMRRHPGYARQLLAPIRFLQEALDIPYAHHERWDGSGYPRGLKGTVIPLAARIFAVADVWDALTSDRPYRPAWTPERAREYILEETGKQFDPAAVEMFFKIL